MKFGFLRLAAAAPQVKVADVAYNIKNIKDKILELDRHGVEIAVLPEMCVTAYTCGDFFHNFTCLTPPRKPFLTSRNFPRT